MCQVSIISDLVTITKSLVFLQPYTLEITHYSSYTKKDLKTALSPLYTLLLNFIIPFLHT